MKSGSRTFLLGVITALMLVGQGLEVGAVLEPATIDSSAPAAVVTSIAQHDESPIALIPMSERARRSIATNAGSRGVAHDTDSHDKRLRSPIRRGSSPATRTKWAKERVLAVLTKKHAGVTLLPGVGQGKAG